MSIRRCTIALLLIWLAFEPAGLQLRADQFVLKDGRTIHGNVKSETPAAPGKDKQFVVEIRPDVFMLISQREIKVHAVTTKPERQYAELMKQSQDSVEFHLRLASWCHENTLTEHETAHYERVIDLDPNNQVARAGLKYAEGKDGRWIKRDVMMTEGGKVNVGGKYRFPEIVALEEARDQAHAERIALLKSIRGWQVDVLTPTRRAAESRIKLETLDGPLASSALTELLFPKALPAVRNEGLPDQLRDLYVGVLTRLADPVAVQTLIRMSINDATEAIRVKCLDALQTIAPQSATAAYINLLNSDNPEEINKAGRALAQLKSGSAVLPLIERLVTKHKRQMAGGGSTDVAFNQQGSYTLGSAKPQVKLETLSNPDVLHALTTITSENFNYDKTAWLAWYANKFFSSQGDLRRDP